MSEKETPLNDSQIEQAQADFEHMQSLAKMDPSIAETPEYKDLMSKISQAESAEEDEEEEESAEEETEEEENEDEEEEETEEDEEEDEDEEEEEVKDDVFGFSKKNKQVKVDVKFDDKAKSFIDKRYSIKDESKFFSSVDKWRTDSQVLTKTQEEYNEIVEGINSLPIEIRTAMVAFSNGDDWRKPFEVPAIDFGKDYSKLDPETVVKHYYPEKHKTLQDRLKKEEDFTDDDYEERINDLYDSAERLFKTEKIAHEKQRAELIASQQEAIKAEKDSAIGSVETLKKEYPDFKSKDVQRIKQILVNGGVEDLFKDKNGRYKPDAAEMLAFALYGKSYLQTVTEKTERKAESKVTKDLVARSKDKPGKKASREKGNKKEADEAIQHLSTEFKSDPYA